MHPLECPPETKGLTIMDHAAFLERIEEALRAKPGTITMSHRLEDLEGWDSIGALAIIAVVDESYGTTLDASALFGCQTVSDLAGLVQKGA
jgi:acyl carrier protein